MRTVTFIVNWLASALLSAIVVVFTLQAFDVPEVGIDDITGQCVWIKDKEHNFEKRECPVPLPKKYTTVIVAGTH